MPDDPHCFTLACQAAHGAMTWFDVFMFCFCTMLVGGWIGYRIGRRVFAEEVIATMQLKGGRDG